MNQPKYKTLSSILFYLSFGLLGLSVISELGLLFSTCMSITSLPEIVNKTFTNPDLYDIFFALSWITCSLTFPLNALFIYISHRLRIKQNYVSSILILIPMILINFSPYILFIISYVLSPDPFSNPERLY